jgi:hypothetical protein
VVEIKTLEKCVNVYGKISPQIQEQIVGYLLNPTYDKWDEISSIIINEDMTTIWQAVCHICPMFPITGRTWDKNHNIIKDWERIPEPLLVLQAIRKATGKQLEIKTPKRRWFPLKENY